ncbi:MAG TPA: hypothetical protein VJ483_05470 [Holophagaceae bacterium]|nr:hypothetical protein [Holophagaceae bacterium]
MITVDMRDAAFLAAVADASLPAEQFDHRAHLQLAWVCLRQDGLEPGSPRVAGLIQAYAEAKGATGKFDVALTRAWMLRVGAALARTSGDDFTGFLAASPELLLPTPNA